MTRNVLQFDAVDFAYGGVPALSNIEFAVPAGTFVAVIGPSGCGKSTLIALAAGLLFPDTGTVHRQSRRLGVVFQDPALLPWRTALGNVALAQVALGLARADRRSRAQAKLAEVGLPAEDAGKYPRQLSGGMRQRVALARALVIEPDLLLCDEPFSALDTQVRHQMRRDLRDLHDRTGLTTLFVTHDQEEALALADIVVVMSMRRIQQIGTPAEIRATPRNAFVRDFTTG